MGQKAGQEEIKKSFRRLAFEFHPDKNPHNNFAAAHFLEIQEAYRILSDPAKRGNYDRELWLAGKLNEKTIPVTPEYLLKELHKLNAHITSVDVYRMNRSLLQEYLLFLLSDEKLGIISKQQDENYALLFTTEIVKTIKLLPSYFAFPVVDRLKLVFHKMPAAMDIIIKTERQKHKEQLRMKLLPWLALLLTIALCLAMYFFSQ